ncbi:AmmeMemoRadiSam system protein B [bacterium]|nr:AmmeMemoRadiSam system protein B [bacterium]
MRRKPAVANRFYEGDPNRLREQLNRLVRLDQPRSRALGIVSPHAGYMFSGAVAGAVYSRIEPAQVYILLGPNHHGFGHAASIMTSGAWDMPFGQITIDQTIAENLVAKGRYISNDPSSHLQEHSLEVQVPFIQFVSPQAVIVPIVLSIRDYSPCEAIAEALAGIIQSETRSVTIVASTDMSHYEPHEITQRKDRLAIDQMVALSPRGLFDYVIKNRISMCGVVPTVIMLLTTLVLGASKAELIQYATSGDASGDYHQVVGYAGLIVT